MKYIITFLMLLTSVALSAQSAATIMDKSVDVYKKSNGMTAKFTVKYHSAKENRTETSDGIMNMKDNKFSFQTSDIMVWFDGKTQWSYLLNSEEVNITTPTEKDLLSSNPMAIMQSYKKHFRVEYNSDASSSVYNIVLTPKQKDDITKVEMRINKFTYIQELIAITTKDGNVCTIALKDVKTKVNQPNNSFVFDEEQFPDVEIIDLR